MLCTFADYLNQTSIKRMLRVRAIKSMITIAPANNETSRLELSDFILNCSQRKRAQPCQLTRIQFRSAIGKQQSQNFRANQRKQSMQQRRFDSQLLLECFKHSSSSSLSDRRGRSMVENRTFQICQGVYATLGASTR